ncbi:unnamed protein product [Ectocarpus fasciculatus]
MVFRPGKSGGSLAALLLLATISCCSGIELVRTCQQLKDRVTPSRVDRGGGPSLITTTLGEGEALSCLEGVSVSPGVEIRTIGATASGEGGKNAGLRAAAKPFTLPRQQHQETWRRAPSGWQQDETDVWVEEEERRLQENGYETPSTGEGEGGGGDMLGEDEGEGTAATTNSTAVANEGDGNTVVSGEGGGDAGGVGSSSSSNSTVSGSSSSNSTVSGSSSGNSTVSGSSSSSNSTEVGGSGGGDAGVNATGMSTPTPAAVTVSATPVPVAGSNDTSEGTFPLEETPTEPPAHVSTEPPASNSSADGAFPLEEPPTEPPANGTAAGGASPVATDAPVGSSAAGGGMGSSDGEGGDAWGGEGGSVDTLTTYEEEYEEAVEEYEEEEEYYEEEYEEEMEEYEEEYEEYEEEYEEYEEEMEEYEEYYEEGGGEGGSAAFDQDGERNDDEENDPSVDDNSFVLKVGAGLMVVVAIGVVGVFVMRRRRTQGLRGEFQGVPHRGLTDADSL